MLSREQIKRMLRMAISMSAVLFTFDIFKDDVEATVLNFSPYLISSFIGGVLTVIYLNLVGYKSSQHLSTMLFMVGLALVIFVVQVFLVEYWFIQNSCIIATFACCSGMLNFEDEGISKKSL